MALILLPVYRPSGELTTVVTALRDAAPRMPIVVVDDGSGPSADPVLDAITGLGCTVLRRPRNEGKGVVLKAGFRYAAETYPGMDVVSADGDGQHGVADILKVAARVGACGHLVLGVRRFDGDVPLRSRVGNTVSRRLFRVATGRQVQDTQTGLRGYPADLLGWLDTIPGERFEYEMNILLYAARDGRPIDETVITTTYLDDNGSSHFSPLSDSARVYGPLLRFVAAALLPSR